jgi:predicted Rossmann fold nucleotide-binding protein DprA/Smf involved in DNA uptake
VLAVPGDVTRPSSEGCNLLIRDGAIPVLGPDDLVEALGLILGPPAVTVAADGPGPVPVTGITVEELALVEGRPVEEMLVELGRRVVEGSVRISQGRVYPG